MAELCDNGASRTKRSAAELEGARSGLTRGRSEPPAPLGACCARRLPVGGQPARCMVAGCLPHRKCSTQACGGVQRVRRLCAAGMPSPFT